MNDCLPYFCPEDDGDDDNCWPQKRENQPNNWPTVSNSLPDFGLVWNQSLKQILWKPGLSGLGFRSLPKGLNSVRVESLGIRQLLRVSVKSSCDGSLAGEQEFPLLCWFGVHIQLIRSLRMGSCLSAESRGPLPCSRSAALCGVRRKKHSRRKLGSRSSSFDSRRDETPGRLSATGVTQFASLFTQQGKKGTNQDAMTVWEKFGSRADTVFCGVFDGHGPYGHMVARRVRDHLPQKLSSYWEVNAKSNEVLREISLNGSSKNSEDESFVSADEQSQSCVDVNETEEQCEIFQTLRESFLKAFKVMDRELKVHRSIDCYCSGTTAVTLVKQGKDLVIGNVGDSRAVMGTRDGSNCLVAVQLTVDLKPNLPAEEERIRRCRGRVFSLQDEPEVARVWLPDTDSPGLAMARAFGDFCLKDYGLISVPEVTHRRLTESDEFIVLATDGIWDVLSNKEAVNIVASAPNRNSAAKNLVESAVRAWRIKYPTSKVDDCAVVCLFLNSETNNGSSSTCNSTKEKEPPLSTEQAEEEDPCGTIRTVKDILPDSSDDELSRDQIDSGTNWSAFEGVTRVNTMVNLPRYMPTKNDKASR
ncbi:hypothetical protein V2J09_000751 [Rumex salicifolius]